MPKYSPQLQNELIAYFQKRFGLVVTADEADEYLDSLADLFLWYGGERY